MEPNKLPRSSGQASSLFSGIVRATPPPPTDIPVPPPSVDMPQPCYSALALDIDGTITTADARVVYGLVQEARQAGSHVAINTARPQLHCSMSGLGRAGRLVQPAVCMAAAVMTELGPPGPAAFQSCETLVTTRAVLALRYCDEPEWGLTTHLVAREHHYCGAAWTRNLAAAVAWGILGNIPKSKVANMDRIAEKCNVPRACALLVDDRPENIEAAERAGYVGVLVDEQTGITPRIARDIMDRLKKCAQAL